MNFESRCRTKMAMQQPMRTYVDIFLACGFFLEEKSKRILHLFCEESVFFDAETLAALFDYQFHVVHDRINFLIFCLSYAYFLR